MPSQASLTLTIRSTFRDLVCTSWESPATTIEMNDNDAKITSWSDCPKLWSTTLTMTVSDSMPVPSCGSASLVVTRARLFCDLGAMVVQQGEDDELNKCETAGETVKV